MQQTLVSILSRCWRTSRTISAVLTRPDRKPTQLSTNLHPLRHQSPVNCCLGPLQSPCWRQLNLRYIVCLHGDLKAGSWYPLALAGILGHVQSISAGQINNVFGHAQNETFSHMHCTYNFSLHGLRATQLVHSGPTIVAKPVHKQISCNGNTVSGSQGTCNISHPA